MSLREWAKAGWLKPQAPTREQIAKIFGVVDRDLEDSKAALSPDGRFNIAYNAALQLCAIVLLAEGWKPEKLNAHHRAISALPLILGSEKQDDADYLDACRAKRNGLEYDAAGRVSSKEASELRESRWSCAWWWSRGWRRRIRSCRRGRSEWSRSATDPGKAGWPRKTRRRLWRFVACVGRR